VVHLVKCGRWAFPPLIKPWAVCMTCREGANLSWRCINSGTSHHRFKSTLAPVIYAIYCTLPKGLAPVIPIYIGRTACFPAESLAIG